MAIIPESNFESALSIFLYTQLVDRANVVLQFFFKHFGVCKIDVGRFSDLLNTLTKFHDNRPFRRSSITHAVTREFYILDIFVSKTI